jgi:plasmid maintenance system antidote protein VapI
MKTTRLPLLHPGEILREEFMLPRRINETVLKKQGMTADTALRRARYFGTSAETWTGLQADYGLRVARWKTPASLNMVLHR